MSNLPVIQSVSDISIMADAIAKSGLFGMKKKEEAMALMLIAQAEGQHPALAARDYHIINGRPTLKADAMLARFQASGGRVDWKSMTDEKVSATFSHPQGGSVDIDWDMPRAKKAQLGGNGMWNKYPRQMLRARCVSEGIRTVFPGVCVGTYTPEEEEDLQQEEKKQHPHARTIDGQATEVQQNGATFTPDWPENHPITKEQAQALFDEASSVLEVVDDAPQLESWRKQYSAKVKNCSQYQYDKILTAFNDKKTSFLNREMDKQAETAAGE